MASSEATSVIPAPDKPPSSTLEPSSPPPSQRSPHQSSSNFSSNSDPPQPKDPPQVQECATRSLFTYTRRQLLNLHASPLVQRPQGMPALKDWFGDWSEQHATSQVKKDGTDANGATGSRRFPRREQEDGDNTARPSFRSTLSQPSQMGNFKHQSLRGDLTRGDRERDRERERDRDRDRDRERDRERERERDRDRDRDRENELRDKDGHERLRSLSDMYDRGDRLALPLALPPIIRSQRERDAAPHLLPTASGTNSSSSGRLREGRDRADRDKERDRDRDGGRRGDNRESGKKKVGESVDWRRGTELSRGSKDDRLDGRSRERSPEVERSRRDRSISRERWGERTREDRRDPKARDKERETYGSRAWREREEEGKEVKENKDTEKARDRGGRDDERRSRLQDLEGNAERDRGGRDRWADRVRETEDTRRRDRERNDGEKDVKDERRERDKEKRERDRERERERTREHPDAKRDRELREGWTITEERAQGAPSGGGRRGGARGAERRQAAGGTIPEEEREVRRERDRDKDKPAWLDDYVPDPAAPKAGIFGGRVEGMDDEIQAWKKKQNPKAFAPADTPVDSTSESPATSTVIAGNGPQASPPNGDEQTKAVDAFFFGLMRGEGAKSKGSEPTRAGAPIQVNSQMEPDVSANKSPLEASTSGSTPSSNSESAAILLATLGVPHKKEPVRETTSAPDPGALVSSLEVNRPSSPSAQQTGFSTSAPIQLGSSALADEPQAKPSALFNPPQQSRVLAFSQAQAQAQPIQPPSARSNITSPNPVQPRQGVVASQQQGYVGANPSPHLSDLPASRVPSLTEQATQRIQAAENMHHQQQRSGFSPFESDSMGSTRQPSNNSVSNEAYADTRNSRASPLTAGPTQPASYDQAASPGAGTNTNAASTYASGRGSRFAKFWDGKTKEAAAAGLMQAQAAAGIVSQGQQGAPPPPPQSVSPSAQQPRRSGQVSPNGFVGGSHVSSGNDIQDMLAILQNTQGTRVHPAGNGPGGGVHRQQLPTTHLQQLHEQQQIPHHQPQPQHHYSGTGSLLDSHQFENRPFVPDGMVPGLRPPRSRESSGLYPEGLDDSPFTVRPPAQQPPSQQVYDQLQGRTSMPQLYSNQAPGAGRAPGGVYQQAPFRGDPSPLGGLGGASQQQQQPPRLPPGLANLGGRPPHDPNGYLSSMGGIHQQPFGGFNAGGGGGTGLGFGGGPVQPPLQRGPIPMQTLLNNTHGGLAASGHPDFTVQHHPSVRGPPGGMIGGGGGGIRGGLGPGPGPGQQIQPSYVGIPRQPQQAGPHLLPQMLPPHLQQHPQPLQAPLHNLHSGQSQNDHLLSMLMGGAVPRE